MIGSRAFTLIEVTMGIAITGLVVTLIYGAAQLGLDLQERLEASRIEAQTDRAWRALVADAFRNARPGMAYGDTALWLESRRSGSGPPMDRVTFVTAGGLAPLTPDADWRVTIEATDSGVDLRAEPVGIPADLRRVSGPPALVGLDVRVLDRETGRWLDSWHPDVTLPAAVEVSYWTESGAVERPLRIVVPAGGAR